MRNEDRWLRNYYAVMGFIRCNGRCPSKYRSGERTMLNWMKHHKKRRARGLMPPHRIEKFEQLMQTAAKYRRVNQYAYLSAPIGEELALPFADD